MEKYRGNLNLSGKEFSGSRIGKVHRFIVEAEHTESRKSYDYPAELGSSSKRSKPKPVIRHEFSVRGITPHKSTAKSAALAAKKK